MDPVTAASTFGAVIGLVCNFRQERGSAANQATVEEFFRWARDSHADLVAMIKAQRLEGEIENLCRRIDDIAISLADLLGPTRHLQGLAEQLLPAAGISRQAIQILRFFNDSGEEFFHKVFTASSGSSGLTTLHGQEIPVEEPRFLEDDLATLTSHGLVHASPDHIDCFRLTRKGTQFLARLQSST